MIERHFHDVYFNGKSLADFGVHVNGTDVFNGPEKDVENVEVPGRNGDLHIFNGRFKNVELKYHAFIAGDEWISGEPGKDFALQMRAMRAWLLKENGYCRIEDTYHPDEYRKGMFKGPITTEAIMLRAGEFDLTFDCMPQRFLKSGEETYTYVKRAGLIGEYELENPTLFDARPFIRIYGTGNVDINNIIIKIDESYKNSYINIDCEIQDAYYGSTNCNKYINMVDGEFFILVPGNNVIKVSKGISKVELIPRWWTV